MALGKLSAFTRLNKKKEEDEGVRPGPAESPGVGDKRPSPAKGGADFGKVAGGVASKVAGPLAAKGFEALTAGPASFNRGASEDAFQKQREGERQDFSSAMPQTAPSWSPWNIGGQPLAPAASFPNIDLTAPDTRFELPGFEGGGGIDGLQGAQNVGTTGTALDSGGFGGLGGALGGLGGILGMLGSVGGQDNKVLAGLGRLGGGINTAMTIANAAQGPAAAAGNIPYVGAALGLANIGMTAAQSGLSDEDKAKQAAMQAVKLAGTLAAPYTFGASLAVTQIMDFINNMDQGMSADEALVRANDPTAIVDLEGGGLANRLYAPSKDWQTFIPNLYENAGNQGEAFNTLAKALPYVQSKEELGQLLNHMKSWTSQVTGIPGSEFGGGYNNPYQIATIPGIGPVTHGQQTKSVDWRGAYDAFQPIIDRYKDLLPGTELTAADTYGTPRGSFAPGDTYGRLWDQFRGKDPTWGSLQHVPGMTINDFPRVMNMSNETPSDMGPDMSNPQTGAWQGSYFGETTPSSWSGNIKDFEYGYDPSQSRLTAIRPGGARPQTMEEAYKPNPLFAQLMGARPGTPGFTGLSGGGQQGTNLQGAAGFAGLRGPAGEILGGDDSYRL